MKSKRKIGDDSEKKAAKKVGASLIRGSGSLWYEKGDYETDKFVFQNKFTSANHYPLKLIELAKAEKDAITKNKDFIFSVEINGEFVYCFPMVLITEQEENILNLISIMVNKQVNIDEKSNFLLNNKYIIIHEYSFKQLKFGEEND